MFKKIFLNICLTCVEFFLQSKLNRLIFVFVNSDKRSSINFPNKQDLIWKNFRKKIKAGAGSVGNGAASS
jgi:hypothetical protein